MPLAKIEEGFSLFYELDDFTDPWKDKETVLLQHGHARNHRLWYAWMPLLAKDFRVIRPDLRGFGNSHFPEGSYKFSLKTFADDLKKLLDSLQIKKVHYVGEGIGGVTGLQFACLYPEYLKSLVLITTPLSVAKHAQTFKSWIEIISREGVEASIRAGNEARFDAKSMDPGHLEWLIKEMGKTPPYVEKACLQELPKFDFTDKVSGINVPTLLIYAGAGRLVSGTDSLTLYDKLPNSELHIYQGATSLVCYTRPEECAGIAKSFWRKLNPSSK